MNDRLWLSTGKFIVLLLNPAAANTEPCTVSCILRFNRPDSAHSFILKPFKNWIKWGGPQWNCVILGVARSRIKKQFESIALHHLFRNHKCCVKICIKFHKYSYAKVLGACFVLNENKHTSSAENTLLMHHDCFYLQKINHSVSPKMLITE